jgi:hypothetical protein
MTKSDINYKELMLKNIYYIIMPFLAIALILGALINGFIIASYVLLIPLCAIGSIILNYRLTRKSKSKNRWGIIVGFAILVVLINYFLLWFFMEIGFKFKFNL